MNVMENIYNIIKIDEDSITHKYLQISNSIIKAIEEKKIAKNYPLPSINDLSFELDISRDTVEKAYRQLKKLSIVDSVPGKGYFITKTDFNQEFRILLLFNKLSAHKKLIYDSFAETLGGRAAIDFYIYNNDYKLFKKIINNRKQEYTHYVIIPHFVDGGKKAFEALNTLPSNKLILLDKLVDGVTSNFAAIYENFKEDIYLALVQATDKLSKYERIKIIFPQDSYYPIEILDGFHQYCREYNINNAVIHKIQNESIQDGDVYINVMEDDLVVLIEKILLTDFELGKNVGIISYNETALKKIILDGITTISTDFKMMGIKTAEIILSNMPERFAIPFYLTLRKSL